MSDLAAAGRRLEACHGLASVEGGRHPGWGTANRIVPLGDAYLELVAVADEEKAARSAFGRWVTGALPAPARPLGWAVRTNQLDAVARRLGLTVAAGSRTGRDGRTLRWRLAGVEEAAAEPWLPFFIEWGDDTPFPGRAAARHPAGAVRVSRLEVAGDARRLAAWLGAHDLPIAVGHWPSPGRSPCTSRAGTPPRRSPPSHGARPIGRVVLSADAGEIVLGP